MTEAIRVERLGVRVGRKTILEDVSLTVMPGRTAAIVGGAGAGKSVFLRTLLGHFTRSSGELRVVGFDPGVNPRDVTRHTTFVANPDVFEPQLTTLQNVVHLLTLVGAPVPDREQLVRALRDVDVPDRLIDARTAELSGLEALAVWLSIASLRTSSLVLLDEPTEFLGPADTMRLASLLHEVSTRGTAVLLTTRDKRFAEDSTSSTYLLESGHILPAHSLSTVASR